MINFYIIAEEDFKDTSLKEENYEGNNRINTRKL